MPSLLAHASPPTETSAATRLMVTPSAAPEAVPSRYGSARGLRNTPCAIPPARPSKAPANQAPTLRGRRICQSTTLDCASGERIQPREVSILDVPMTRLPKVSTSVIATQASNHTVSRFALVRSRGASPSCMSARGALMGRRARGTLRAPACRPQPSDRAARSCSGPRRERNIRAAPLPRGSDPSPAVRQSSATPPPSR